MFNFSINETMAFAHGVVAATRGGGSDSIRCFKIKTAREIAAFCYGMACENFNSYNDTFIFSPVPNLSTAQLLGEMPLSAEQSAHCVDVLFHYDDEMVDGAPINFKKIDTVALVELFNKVVEGKTLSGVYDATLGSDTAEGEYIEPTYNPATTCGGTRKGDNTLYQLLNNCIHLSSGIL